MACGSSFIGSRKQELRPATVRSLPPSGAGVVTLASAFIGNGVAADCFLEGRFSSKCRQFPEPTGAKLPFLEIAPPFSAPCAAMILVFCGD